MLRLGVHISIKKGLLGVLEEARFLGCNTIQIFIRNPRSYKRKPITSEEIRIFRNRLKKRKIYPFAVHSSYIINLASSDKALRKKSISLVKEDLKLCNDIDANLYIIHFGSNKDTTEGLKLMCDSLLQILNQNKRNPFILLENTAGEGKRLGGRMEHIFWIVKEVPEIGICLDTAHLFSAGYDIRKKYFLNNFFQKMEKKLSWKRIKLIHLNDSYYPLGAKRDRHQHIGSGYIGERGFRIFLHYFAIRKIPLILETPKKNENDDIRNINKVKYLAT